MKILDVPQSGSIAGITSSRNRNGQYRRTRAIPVNPNTTFQGTQRSRFGDQAQAWRNLTDAQRLGWISLAASIIRTDALGQTYDLTGIQCFCMVNINNLDAGNAVVADAPALTSPAGLVTAVITSTGGTLSVAYTLTPLGSGERLFVYASPQRSPGRKFEADLRLVHKSAAAAASPANILSDYTARFGAPVVGNKIFLSFQVYKLGFLSAPLLTSHIVVT